MFDRDVEWMELAAFAGDQWPGATLGVVSGRRRQGKTFLLRALCEATRAGADDREALLAIGEAKWHETMGIGHLERLRHIRGLLTAQGRLGAAAARLLCFSSAGFSPDLVGEAARSGDIRLLTPEDLYTGILLPEVSACGSRPTPRDLASRN